MNWAENLLPSLLSPVQRAAEFPVLAPQLVLHHTDTPVRRFQKQKWCFQMLLSKMLGLRHSESAVIYTHREIHFL